MTGMETSDEAIMLTIDFGSIPWRASDKDIFHPFQSGTSGANE